jgi:hypothetical protein
MVSETMEILIQLMKEHADVLIRLKECDRCESDRNC